MKLSLGTEVSLVAAATMLGAALLVPLGLAFAGAMGALAAGLAAAICLASAVAALAVDRGLRRRDAALAAVLASMLTRLSLPLVATIVVALQSAALVRAGFVYYLLGFYLLNLAVETALAVLRARSAAGV